MILSRARPVDPSDKEPFRGAAEALYIGTGGNLSLVLFGNKGEKPVVFKNVPDGTFLNMSVLQVMKKGTTAKDIVALDA